MVACNLLIKNVRKSNFFRTFFYYMATVVSYPDVWITTSYCNPTMLYHARQN